MRHASLILLAVLVGCSYDVPAIPVPDIGPTADMAAPVVQSLPFSRIIQAGTPATGESTATCPTDSLVISGSCVCTVGTLTATEKTSAEGWRCKCSTGEATASAVCLLPK